MRSKGGRWPSDFAPDGFGPIELLQGFLRFEVRYDCVWTRGCGIFSRADAFGDRARKLPKRLGDGRRAGFRPSGALYTGHARRFADIPRRFLSFDYKDMPDGSFRPSELFDIGGLDTLFGRGATSVSAAATGPGPGARSWCSSIRSETSSASRWTSPRTA